MKMGFVATYTPQTAAFAAEAGFDGLEIFAGPDLGFNLDSLTDDDAKRLAEDAEKLGIRLLTLSLSPIHMDGDPSRRAEANAYFVRAIKRCRLFGADTVVTNAWSDGAKPPAENIRAYKEVFSEYAKAAESENVKIAIENCPHWLGYPVEIRNIGFSPEMWDAMFEAVPSEAIGLEFDPSHLVWLGIDYLRALRDYGSRVYAFHAKDTEILEDKRYKYGIIGKQLLKKSEWDAGWWRYRMPGFGQIDWKGVFNALYESGFAGPMIIEHEDPVFGGDRSEDGSGLGPLTEKGLTLGLRYLRGLDILEAR